MTTDRELDPTARPILFNQASLEGAELDYMAEATMSGRTATSGPYAKRAAALLQEESGAKEVLLTTSCTSALELAAMLLDLRPGETVVVPSFTFVSTALAFAREGARIIFCDIERQTLGLDPDHLTQLLDESVRAVVPIHYAGVACDLERIRAAIADWPQISLIEDNAHGLYGRWRGQPLGSFGRFATLSFHETKNIACGEGGALLLHESRDVDRARILFDKGTNRRAFFLGQVDKYSWMDNGSSFGLADILAAHLYAQLEQREVIQAKRRAVFERYERLLAPHADRLGFTMPVVPDGAEQTYHMFYVLLPDRSSRDGVLKSMQAEGIHPTSHYVPLHNSQGGARFAAYMTECPVTDDVSGRLLRLPFYNNLSPEQSERVVTSFLDALSAISA
jgi:dTDP-4-amino-4,6-dideoxygalactose transaminase